MEVSHYMPKQMGDVVTDPGPSLWTANGKCPYNLKPSSIRSPCWELTYSHGMVLRTPHAFCPSEVPFSDEKGINEIL